MRMSSPISQPHFPSPSRSRWILRENVFDGIGGAELPDSNFFVYVNRRSCAKLLCEMLFKRPKQISTFLWMVVIIFANQSLFESFRDWILLAKFTKATHN